jgi:hypothetical protein
MDLWHGNIEEWLPNGCAVTSLEKQTYFGGLYQKVIITR